MTVSPQFVAEQGQQKPNNRLGNKKTKTGCLTCKARKVKCDEAKPICKRCINADRTCRGYVDVFVPSDVVGIRSREPSAESWYLTPPTSRSVSPLTYSSPKTSPNESRALQYYQIEVARLLGGSVDPHFWTKSVLQLSEYEPAIKHALMAISTEWESKLHANVQDRSEAQRVSMVAYSKALRHTTQRLNEPGAETVALATCVLFLCLHCLQGDQEQANKILQSGSGVMFKILQSSSCQSQNPESLVSTFLPIFERIVVLLRLFGVRVPPFRSTEKVLYNADGSFCQLKTIDDSRSVLYWLVSESHDLMVATKSHRTGEGVEPAISELHQKLQEEQLHAYHSWLQEFDVVCSSIPVGEHSHYIAQLRLVHAVTSFWVAICLDPYETLCDNYHDSFETIIRNAEEVVAYNNTCTSTSLPFTFEMGVIAPLYLTILKCREPSLRSQALDLMRRAPEREGLWRRDEALRVAQRVADLENKEYEVLGDGTVFQNARIYDAQTMYSDEIGTHITLSAKLYGSAQSWKIWDEILPHQEHSSDWCGGF